MTDTLFELTSRRQMRRALDFYETPAWATKALLQRLRLPPRIRVLEPCAGDGSIARVLRDAGVWVATNDVDRQRAADTFYDACELTVYQRAAWRYDWVITNPPFSSALPIVQQAVVHARVGVACLLRLSFLEPTEDRGAWLAQHPPTGLLVLPRISFTGDGSTDSVTCAWMVWQQPGVPAWIEVVSRWERRGLLWQCRGRRWNDDDARRGT